MKNLSTGMGLALLAGAIFGSTVIVRFGPVDQAAHAALPTEAANAIVAASLAQVPPPTIVWMGVTSFNASNANFHIEHLYRMWSDGRLEVRCLNNWDCTTFSGGNWIEIPPPPAGNGFACRADFDGNRVIDGADLAMVLAGWGPQPPCDPEPTYPCMNFGGGS